jgi:uncharacterized protein (UPF0297 family)
MYLNLSYEKKNPDVTLEELIKKMSGRDLDALLKSKRVTLEDLWDSYCQVMFTKNPFGLISKPGTDKFKYKIVENVVPVVDPKHAFKLPEKSVGPNTFNFEKSKTKKAGKRNKRKSKRKTQKGGVVLPEDSMVISPSWRNGPGPDTYNTLVNIIPVHDVNSFQVYGSSLPYVNEDDEIRCFETLSFYMYRHEIRRIISFQACAINPEGNHLHSYDPTYFTMENDTWNILKSLNRDHRLDPSYTFIDMFCRDMTQGNADFWEELDALDFIGENNRSLIHCYAGFGRTGAALLFLTLKENLMRQLNTPQGLLSPFIGLGNSRAMYTTLKAFLNARLQMNQNPVNGAFQAEIDNFDKDEIAEEVFRIADNENSTFHANLFISRINLMFTQIGNQFLGPGHQITLYRLHAVAPVGGFTPDNIFQNPVLIAI